MGPFSKNIQNIGDLFVHTLREEASDIASEVEDKSVLDAALIAAAQAVEHYEMSRYGTLIARANGLGHSDTASVLQLTLDDSGSFTPFSPPI